MTGTEELGEKAIRHRRACPLCASVRRPEFSKCAKAKKIRAEYYKAWKLEKGIICKPTNKGGRDGTKRDD